MSREQFFKPNNQEKPKIEIPTTPEQPADWEIAKVRHLAAKEEFHKARMAAHLTGEEKYQANKSKKYAKSPDRLFS